MCFRMDSDSVQSSVKQTTNCKIRGIEVEFNFGEQNV